MRPTAIFVLLFSTVAPQPLRQAGAHPLAFVHVSVVDVSRGRTLPDSTVIVTGTRITSVGKATDVKLPRDAETIDATGKFLLPGLWDMHIHALTDRRYEWIFPLLVANGVTGIREMGNNLPPDEANRVRSAVADGSLLGPRIGALTYRLVDGEGTRFPNAVAVKTPDEGRQLVRTFKQLGVDFIKPYNLLSRDAYLAVADEAKLEGLPVEGHVPLSMTPDEVIDAGQVTIEHNFGVLLAVSRDEELLRPESRSSATAWGPAEAKAAASYDEKKAGALFARMARTGTWSCPTIIFYRPVILLGDDTPIKDSPAMRYVPRLVRERWHTLFESQTRNMTLPEYRKVHYEMRSRIVGEMHRAGVRMLAGTDAAAPYAIPGLSLQAELEALVDAGLSPLDGLRAATINAARFLGKEPELGTVEAGKLADLLLLKGNPLDRITNTAKIDAVVLNGRLLDRKHLDELLAGIEAASSK